jgi:uncharacterized protein with GYD domain
MIGSRHANRRSLPPWSFEASNMDIHLSHIDFGRLVMATYIMLSKWTDQGIHHVQDSPQRLDAARQLCRQHGAEITAFYMTMGAYDMVIVIDAPNDDAFARLAISIAKGGNVRSETLKACDEDQYRKIIASIG